ncbi:MAG TPA: hypothetical protein VN944_09710 [Nitrospiria bacterium]|nr:hypothetical protein [Nitrospiria bacterium]
MKTISISEYARRKAVTRQRIYALISRGVLVKEPGGGINPAKADRALKRSLDPTRESKIKGLGRAARGDKKSLLAEKTRLTASQATLSELKEAEESSRLIDKNVMLAVMDKLHLAFRSRVLARSAKMAPVLFGCETLVELQAALKDSDHECLTELAGMNPAEVIASDQPEGAQKKKVKSRRKRR